jgi:hypothetical protein
MGMGQNMHIWRGKGRQWGGASTEAVIATPAFVALVLTAIELIVISWKVLSLQMIANQAARDYAVWDGCSGTGRWNDCRTKNSSSDWVLESITDKIINTVSKKHALNMTTANTQVTVRTVGENNALNMCGQPVSIPGTDDGRGDLFEITIILKNDILGLGLFKFDLEGRATAVLEAYGK